MTTPTRPDLTRSGAEASPVSVAVDVAAPVEHVFDVFTRRTSTWWDAAHHLLDGTVDMDVELRPGGSITEVDAAGNRCTIGRVLVVERPARFAFTWDVSPRWEVETDPARCSEVHVAFTALDDGRTRVVLEHRHLQRHGGGWEGMRDAVGGADGWAVDVRRLAEVAGA
ncbi:SRPBCC domain-containing protein [Isoptericola sp. NPDC056573]|uniref:SRPBCC domain-containing protein n=1 Tax=Isoptericola sp. NPDC056573 TaxID=3345868 RepID=UPI0036B91D26